jgi:hypothetical protein
VRSIWLGRRTVTELGSFLLEKLRLTATRFLVISKMAESLREDSFSISERWLLLRI